MRWVVAVAFALILLWSTSANAQSIPSPPAGKPTAAEEATAKRNWDTGRKLYGEGAFAEALVAFEQAYRVGGRASALKDIAQCHRSLKHFFEAYEAYELMLARHDAQIPAAEKKAVQQALEELGVLTATVIVDVNEADAEIEIDGKSVGRSPMAKPKRVAVTGSHSVRVTKPTFARFEQTFTVDSQQAKKIDVKLEVERTTGHVLVREQRGRDVHVFVDGEDKGPAPWEGDLSAGEHTVEAKSAGFASESRRVNVIAKERLDLSLDATPMTGRLRVSTIPATADIKIDGKTYGTGVWEGDLPEGAHRIEVTLQGQTTQIRDVVLSRGQLISQEIPIFGAIVGPTGPVYPGIYARFSLFGHLGPVPDNSVEPFTKHLDGGAAAQAGAALRIGRNWDWYGAEVVGLLALEIRNNEYQFDDATTTPSQTRNFQDRAGGVNAFIGIGPRVTSKNDTVRFTFGIAPGIAVHSWFNPKREYDDSGGSSNPSNPSGANRFVQGGGGTGPQNSSGSSGSNEQEFPTAGYTTFGFVTDVGVMFGSTPGTKFVLGLQVWIDFAPTVVTGPDTRTPIPDSAFKQPGRGITLAEGTQFYIGPTLGLQFGH